jgi:tetratricopeptide (TPR) repeat protein
MATRFKSVIALLAAVVVVGTSACASDPASNIDATIEAGIAATMVVVEIEKAVKATMAPSLAKEHFNRGFVYGELGEYRKAIQEYDKAIQLDLNYASAYQNRGIAYDELGEYQRAIKDYDKAIQLDPNDGDAYYTRGNAYVRLGEWVLATQDYDKACSLGTQYYDC